MAVLLVDDEPEILAVLQEHLAFAGIHTVAMTSAPDAVRMHRQERFPVVLSDIRMPGMSGVEMIRQIKKVHPTCIVFVMTGYATLATLVECLELGAVDYFIKPFEDMPLLVASIQDALQRHERWRTELYSMRPGTAAEDRLVE